MSVSFCLSILLTFLIMTVTESCRPFLNNIWEPKTTNQNEHLVEADELITLSSDISTNTQFMNSREQLPHFHLHGSRCPPIFDEHFCENNGTCVAMFRSGSELQLECNCKRGFGGFRCLDKEISVLSDSSDQVKTITNDIKELGTTFECPKQYAEHFCMNNGTCLILLRERTENILDYSCQCKGIYVGPRCQFKQPEIEPIPPTSSQIRSRRGLSRMRESPNHQKRATGGKRSNPTFIRKNKFLMNPVKT